MYIIGALWMFRLSIKLQITKGNYDWDMEDAYDLFFLTFLAFFAAILWPFTLLGGLLMALVKKTYLKGSN